jgi:hypothetical protein
MDCTVLYSRGMALLFIRVLVLEKIRRRENTDAGNKTNRRKLRNGTLI